MSDGSFSAPATIEALQAALAQRDEELVQLKAVLNQKDAALEEQRAAMREKDAELARKASEISRLQGFLKRALVEVHGDTLAEHILHDDEEARGISSMLEHDGLEFVIEDLILFSDKYNDNVTPLSFACAHNKPKVVEALLAKGANVEATIFGDGRTPLYYAAYDCPAAVPMLLAKGADVNAVYSSTGDGPLHRATTVEALRALVEAGADLNARNKAGETPLTIACEEECVAVVRFLLEQPGTDVTARDEYGHGVIHHAALSYSEKVMEAVLACPRVDITAVDNGGNTALHHAAMSSSSRTVQPLLPHFDDVNVKNNAGCTPLEVARKGWSEEVIIVLLEAGAVVNFAVEKQLLADMSFFLKNIFKNLYRNPTAPLPAYRKTLCWAMTSRVVEAALPSIRAEAGAAAPSSAGAGRTAALPADIEDTKAVRLALLREDAWKRRGHLVFDRAMTIREAEREADGFEYRYGKDDCS